MVGDPCCHFKPILKSNLKKYNFLNFIVQVVESAR